MGYIYSIKSKINGKFYIGLTNNWKNRKRQHFCGLRNNKHDNSYLQNHYNKYGPDCFEFEIIEEYDNEFLPEREQYWIKYYNSFNREFGFNLTTGGEKPEFSEETRQKISQNKKNKQKLYVYDLNGNLINIFNSIIECASKLNLNRTGINQAIKNNSRCGNFLFSKSLSEKIDPYKKKIKYNYKNTYVYDKNGILLSKHCSITDAAKCYNISMSCCYLAYKNNFLVNKKYYFSPLLDFEIPKKIKTVKPCYVYQNSVLIKTFNSLKETANFYDINFDNLRGYIERKTIHKKLGLLFSTKKL